VRIKLQVASIDDAADLLLLRNAASERLEEQFGEGFWSGRVSEKGVLFAMRVSTMYIARHRHRAIATLSLSIRKPWAIDRKYFSTSRRPLHSTSMAVSPDEQRKGIGRLCHGGSAPDW